MKKFLEISFDPENRIYGLDIIRAIAILLVVITHGNLIINKAFPEFPYIKLIDGVEMFFVLSGFLIGTILFKKFDNEPINFSGLLSFWKRRWFRTLPNYFLFLLLNVVFAYLSINTWKFDQFNWKFFLFIQNLYEPFSGFFLESWSLSIEEWFYISLPLLIFGFTKFIDKKRSPLIGIFILIIAPLIYRFTIADQEVDYYWWDVSFRKIVITRLDTIGWGVLMAFLLYYFPSRISKFKTPLFVLGLIVILADLYCAPPINSFYTKTLHFTILSIGISCLIPQLVAIRSYRGTIGKYVTQLSIISYSMYLVNLSIVALVLLKQFDIVESNAIKFYLIYWLATIIISVLIYKYYEKPMTNLRDKF